MANAKPELAIVPTEQGANRLVKKTVFDLTADEFTRLQYIAKAYAASNFNPKQKQGDNWKPSRTQADYELIMLKGMELGFSPMAAVDMISIINGKPAVDGKGMLAIIYASNEAEGVQIIGSNTEATVTIQRKGFKTAFVSTFTIKDAEAMGLLSKEGNNYKKQPKTMLIWRAVAACTRIAFPDYLGGLYTQEELAPDYVQVSADGSMEILPAPAASQAPQLQAPAQPSQEAKRDINNVDEWLDDETGEAQMNEHLRQEEAAKLEESSKANRAWMEQLADIVAPMYRHENHLRNGITAALDSGEIDFTMSLDAAASNLFKHRCKADFGLDKTELTEAIQLSFGQEGLRGYMANNPRDYAGAWRIMNQYAAQHGLLDEPAPKRKQEQTEDFPM